MRKIDNVGSEGKATSVAQQGQIDPYSISEECLAAIITRASRRGDVEH